MRTATHLAISALICLLPNTAPALDVMASIGTHDKPQRATGRRSQVLAFTASWCGPCQKFKRQQVPRMKASGWEFSDDGHVRFIDVDQQPELAKRYGVASMPTFVFLRDGEEASRREGYLTAEQLHASMRASTGASARALETAADHQPTPYPALWQALAKLRLKPSDTFVDFGCGDGRACIEAVQGYGCKAIGIEIDPHKALEATENVKAAGFDDRIEIILGDATRANVEGTAAFCYLWPDTLEDLKPRLTQAERVVSYQHRVPGLAMQQVGDLWYWQRGWADTEQPARQRRQPQASGNVAYWNGRAYRAPVCNSRTCTMCNSIRRQLR